MFPNPGGFPLFSGKVQIVSRTLSGLFLVGALNRPRKRKRTNRENPRRVPEQIGKIPGKVPKGQKRTKKEGRVQIGKPPRSKHPRLAALESGKCHIKFCKATKETRRHSTKLPNLHSPVRVGQRAVIPSERAQIWVVFVPIYGWHCPDLYGRFATRFVRIIRN